MEEEEEVLQAKTEAAEPAEVSADVEGPIRSLSGGSPLPDPVRSFMEPRFGADFGGVRVHTGDHAAGLARSVNAHAFTVDNDIVFGAGQYDPDTAGGKQLLAHELTHVVQQSGKTPFSHHTVQRRCPQGNAATEVNGDCSPSRESDSSRFITHLHVSKTGGNQATVIASWSDGSSNSSWAATLNDSETPEGNDHVGTKCTVNHTNNSTHHPMSHMAYFTGLHSHGQQIGFHNSQPVGRGRRSHGCIRVSCSAARIINENTRSYDASTSLPSTRVRID